MQPSRGTYTTGPCLSWRVAKPQILNSSFQFSIITIYPIYPIYSLHNPYIPYTSLCLESKCGTVAGGMLAALVVQVFLSPQS